MAGCNCCDQKLVVVDVTGCRPRQSNCKKLPQFCPDGSFPEHPSFGLFKMDPRFDIFRGIFETDRGKSSINYLLWVYEEDYRQWGYKGLEMLHYHIAHLLFAAVVSGATEAQAKQIMAAKGTNTMRVVTETFAEGSASISSTASDFYTTPFGRTLATMKAQREIGFLAL